jgi:ABC-2 type transport system ATP-binding protein
MLKINALTKKFYEQTVAKNISLEIRPGEIFSLIGPNGSGKTTIVKIIAGLLHPTAGSISVNEKDVQKDPIGAKAQIGYIPDEPSVWPNMTGEEFLHISGALFGVKAEERSKRIPELLHIFNMQDLGKNYFEDCSRGSKQKISILAALLHKPKLLLIDEPIVGLDPASANIACEQFVDFARNGGSIFLVTHTLQVAEKISNRIGVLKKGELCAMGTIEELRKKTGLTDANLNDIYMSLA